VDDWMGIQMDEMIGFEDEHDCNAEGQAECYDSCTACGGHHCGYHGCSADKYEEDSAGFFVKRLGIGQFQDRGLTVTYPTISNWTEIKREKENNVVSKELIERQARSYQEMADKQLAKLAFLESLPKEPTGIWEDESEPIIIQFNKKFGNGQTYQYAAIGIRTRIGQLYRGEEVMSWERTWYTTGPKTPKAYSWDDLIQWIYGAGDEDVEIWVVTGLEKIN
jgi:hypothetical protein